MIMCAWKETFFSMPMPPKDAPLKLLLAGFTHKDASYRIVRNGLDDIYVLEYVISGKGHLHWGDKYYTPTAGDVYLLQPHVSHEYYSDPADPWEKIWFNLSGPLMDALCDAYRLHGVVYFHHCRLEKEFPLLGRGYAAPSEPGDPSRSRIARFPPADGGKILADEL